MRCSRNKIVRKSHNRKSYRRRDGSLVKKTRVSKACVRRSKKNKRSKSRKRSMKKYKFMSSIASSAFKSKAKSYASSLKNSAQKYAVKNMNKVKDIASKEIKAQVKSAADKL